MGDTTFDETAGYESPVVIDYGDLVDLTAKHTNGALTDQSFPAGTPKGDITFS